MKERRVSERKLETLKVIKVKNLEHKFAPLYYKRITYKLIKDAKTFNFPIYFALINVLYANKLWQPCISLLSLFIDEISQIYIDLYDQQKDSQKTRCFLHLYEFFVFIQVYLLITIGKFDRALYALTFIKEPSNEINTLLHKTFMGLSMTHCFYFDLSIYYFSEASHLVKPLVDAYETEDEDEKDGILLFPKDKKKKEDLNPQIKNKKTPESIYDL